LPREDYIWFPAMAYDEDYYWFPEPGCSRRNRVFYGPPAIGLGATTAFSLTPAIGPEVGFYGGINYGFVTSATALKADAGIRTFLLQPRVTNVNVTVIHNVYETRVNKNRDSRQLQRAGARHQTLVRTHAKNPPLARGICSRSAQNEHRQAHGPIASCTFQRITAGRGAATQRRETPRQRSSAAREEERSNNPGRPENNGGNRPTILSTPRLRSMNDPQLRTPETRSSTRISAATTKTATEAGPGTPKAGRKAGPGTSAQSLVSSLGASVVACATRCCAADLLSLGVLLQLCVCSCAASSSAGLAHSPLCDCR